MPEPIVLGSLICLQDGLCTYCRKPLPTTGYHIDHKTPVSRGGSNDEDNLQLLCAPCNMDKRARTHEEYLKHLGMIC